MTTIQIFIGFCIEKRAVFRVKIYIFSDSGRLTGSWEQPWRKKLIRSARRQKICPIAATGVHAVHPIVPGHGKDFRPV
jgi:hypothetical protein